MTWLNHPKRLGVLLLLLMLVLAACVAGRQATPAGESALTLQSVAILRNHSEEAAVDGPTDDSEEADGGASKKEARFDWFWRQRAYPLTTVPFMASNRALEQTERMRTVAQDAPWQSLGPAPLLEEYQNDDPQTGDEVRTTASGRVTGVTFDPNNPNTLYVATAGGGVWKSVDKGANFVSITSSRPEFAYASVAVDPNNSNIVYAGTGDLTGYYGNGVLKSSDGGATWTLYGANEFGANAVMRVIVDPSNSNRIYTATAWSAQRPSRDNPPNKGVFRSNDGGVSWQRVLDCNPCNTGFTDLLMDPSNPQTLYAGNAGVGVFKSVNGGDSWAPLPDFSAKVGRQNYSRLEMAIGAGAGSSTLYAGIDGNRNVNGNLVPWGFVYRSTDGGQNWQALNPNNTPNYCGGQCWYDNVIAINPANPNEVFLGGVDIFRTTDGGQSWTNIRQGVHVDQHAAAFDPTDAGAVWVGNDGGLFRFKNGQWLAFNTGITSLQFTGLGVHPTNANLAVGGMQDNSHAIFDGTDWKGFSFADGNKAEFDPADPSIVYHGDQQISFSANQGSTVEEMRQNAQDRLNGIDFNDNAGFYIPFEVDPNSAGVIYLGTDKIYRTANRGVQWTAISQALDDQGNVLSIGVPPSDANTLYAGTTGGLIFKGSRDPNGQWTWVDLTNTPLPNRFLSDIAVHPTNANIVYLAYNGFSANTPGQPGHIFKSENGGMTWTRVDGAGVGAFPDVPALTILMDPDNPANLYVGTDIGVFRSTDGGASWAPYSQGLPPVPVTDLKYTQANKLLWAATYGRSIYRTSLSDAPPTPTPTDGPTPTPTMTPVNTPTPTMTPTPPAAGVTPGVWAGDVVSFQVASNQTQIYDFRVEIDFGNCTQPLQYNGPIAIDGGGNFSFTVDDRNSSWRVTGQIGNQSASGSATFNNVSPSTSMCGAPFTGTIDWTANWSASAPDPTPTPVGPPPTPTPTPVSASGINGQVRFDGEGLPGVELGLFLCATDDSTDCNPEEDAPFDATVTDAGGFYNFADEPALLAGEEYFVFYLNDESGGNQANDRYLYRWFGESITDYAGGSRNGGGFEIGEVRLLAPNDDITAALPLTFEWTARPAAAGENYAWQLLDLNTGESVCESAPAMATSFTLDQAFFDANCGGVAPGVEYGWLVWAIDGADFDTAGGFGDSYYVGALTFGDGQVRIFMPVVRR